MRVKDMLPGQNGKIISFTSGAAEYRQRLLMLGLVPGTQFELQRYAPFGDPVEIKVRGSLISLRKGEADVMEVEAAQ
jgi:ferrous iron transport protein A